MVLSRATMRAMRSSGTLLCLASATAFGAMAAFGKLAYDAGATVGTLLTVRFGARRGLLWALLLGAARVARACALPGARDVGVALALGALRLRAPGGLLLRRARAHRRLAAVAARLHVPRDRRRRGDRARPRARRRAPHRGARCSPPAGWRSSWPAPARARSTRSASRSGSAPRRTYATYILVSEGIAAPRRAARAHRARLHRRRGVLTAGSALTGQLRPGALTAAGWGWLACIAVVCTVAAVSLFFAGPRARRCDDRLDPRHRSSRS